mgnify:FL=1
MTTHNLPIEVRFWGKVDTHGPLPESRQELGPCWVWTAAVDSKGYGRFQLNRQNRIAHRVAFELRVGPIPSDLELDHLCRTRNCVNPEHMEAVTHLVNMHRGVAPTIALHLANRCRNGHPLTEGNVLRAGKYRCCKTCRQVARRVYAARKRGPL